MWFLWNMAQATRLDRLDRPIDPYRFSVGLWSYSPFFLTEKYLINAGQFTIVMAARLGSVRATGNCWKLANLAVNKHSEMSYDKWVSKAKNTESHRLACFL